MQPGLAARRAREEALTETLSGPTDPISVACRQRSCEAVAMQRLAAFAVALLVTQFGCGGGSGGGDCTDLTYSSYPGAGGAGCNGDGGSGECRPGDRCETAGVCALVAPQAQACGLLCAGYASFPGAGGVGCNGDGGSGECMPGDRCVGAGDCEAVLSALRSEPDDCSPIGRSYSAFPSAGGVSCLSDGGDAECYPGDNCIDPGSCEIVLSVFR
jgi:hypothetical protein